MATWGLSSLKHRLFLLLLLPGLAADLRCPLPPAPARLCHCPGTNRLWWPEAWQKLSARRERPLGCPGRKWAQRSWAAGALFHPLFPSSSVVGSSACVFTQPHDPGQWSSLSVDCLSLHSLPKLLSLQAISAHSLCICHCSIYSFSFSIFIPALFRIVSLQSVPPSVGLVINSLPGLAGKPQAGRSAHLHPSDRPHASGLPPLTGDPRSSGKTAVANRPKSGDGCPGHGPSLSECLLVFRAPCPQHCHPGCPCALSGTSLWLGVCSYLTI